MNKVYMSDEQSIKMNEILATMTMKVVQLQNLDLNIKADKITAASYVIAGVADFLCLLNKLEISECIPLLKLAITIKENKLSSTSFRDTPIH